MIDLMNNLVLMGEGLIQLAKDIVIYAGGGFGGLFILYKGFRFIKKL